MQCVKACTAGAVCHDQQPEEIEIDAGSVILTPGFEEFQGSLRGEFGHGRYANVLSSVQFERMLSAAGPTGGHVQRPSDGGEVERIAFIQCVGSRDAARGNGYCSSICCMSATKEAMVALEHAHGKELDVSIFCMDVRAFGKEFDGYVNRARDEHGVKYIRAIPSRVVEMPGTKNPRVRYFDQAGIEQQQEFDLVVLSVGMQVPDSVRQTAGRLGLELNQFGFAQTERLAPLATSKPGLYVAGAFQEPKDIPESVAQASAAAACAMDQLAEARGTLIQRREYPWERDITDEPPRVGVFICHCGQNIASVIDVEEVARKASALPNVCPRRSQLVHLLRHEPAAHQGHDREAPAQPAGGGLLLAAHSRDPLPGDAARQRAEPVPVRDGQYPRPGFVGAQGRPRGGHGQGGRPDGHGGGAGAASEGAADRDNCR